MDWIGIAIPQSEPCFRSVGRETGWSLYAAVLLVMARRLLESLLFRLASAGDIPAERLRIASAVVLPILLAAFLAPPPSAGEREDAPYLRKRAATLAAAR